MTDETTYEDVVEEMGTTRERVLGAIETLERGQRGLCFYQLQLFEAFLESSAYRVLYPSRRPSGRFFFGFRRKRALRRLQVEGGERLQAAWDTAVGGLLALLHACDGSDPEPEEEGPNEILQGAMEEVTQATMIAVQARAAELGLTGGRS